jgi:acylglycerol lipase
MTLAATTSTTERVRTADGLSLLVRHWPTTTTAPWARVLLVHGLAEHSGRWEHVGAQLAAEGLDVTGFDQRGFGASEGRRAWVDRWSRFHDDIEERMAALRGGGPEPLVLYGHSLGGLIALGYVLDGRPQPDALVLSAPALGSTIPGWKRLVASACNVVLPKMRISNGLDPNDLCRDAAVAAAYTTDPLNVHRSTVSFGVQAFAEQERVLAALDRIGVPTFVIHGEEDRIVPTASSAVLGQGERPGVTRRVYPGILHELHNEADGPAILDDVVTWLRGQFARD